MDDQQQFERLKREIGPYRNLMETTVKSILNQEISNYPIFIFHQSEIEIGIPLISGAPSPSPWQIHISTLEELATKGVVAMEKVREFQSIYKDPNSFFCIFLVKEEKASFVFIPQKDNPYELPQ